MLKILFAGDNQLCNKLLFSLNMYASAIEYGFAFEQDYSWLPDGLKLKDDPRVKKYKKNQTVDKIINLTYVKRPKWLQIIPGNVMVTHLKENKKFQQWLKNGKIKSANCYWIGWPYYDMASLRKHDEEVRTMFFFEEETDLFGERQLQVWRENSDVVIGVHMRRGDYATWNNGKFFYTDEQYKKVMDNYALRCGKSVAFVLFSNGAIDMNVWKDAKYRVVQAKGSAIQDLCCLSKCDYLMGPPSTFSGIASYLGNIPRMIIEDPYQDVSDKKFGIWLLQTDTWGNIERQQ